MPNTHSNLAQTTAAAVRSSGGGSLTVADASRFATPTADAPMRLVVYRGETFRTILKAVGLSGSVFAIDGTADGEADADVAIGDIVANVPTKGDFDDLWASDAALQQAIDDIELTPGPAGADGSVWREGSGVPSDGTGVDGDYYLDGSTGDVYLRATGAYSIVANIKGPTGADGATGSAGSPGADGADGSVWRDGSGAPSSGLGVNGDYYLDGSTGDVYLKAAGAYSIVANIKGATGAAGADGATGPAGVGSFGLTLPSEFAVANSPLTSSGTIAATWADATANYVMAGPTTGSPATPAFRALVAADIPTIAQSQVTNLTTDLAAKATDSLVVHKSGTETITGAKSFTATTVINLTTFTSTAATTETVSTSNKELVFEQTGDFYGTTRLKLQNRNGCTGALFEQTNGAGINVVDFVFATVPSTRNIRMEARSAVYKTGTPEFQFGAVNNWSLIAGDSAVLVRDAMTIYSTSDTATPLTPQATLDVRGGVRLKRTAVSTTPFSVTANHYLMAVTGPSSARAINLPSAPATGQVFVIVDEAGNASTNNITVTPAASGTINGASTYVINTDRGVLRIYHAGSNAYFVI